MRYVSLFSGIEAVSVAWRGLDMRPVLFSELDPFPCAVLAERFPEVPNLGDVTKIDWEPYVGAVDVVAGGSPCQSFSIAGTRTGLDGASGLMWEFVRAVRELRPRWVLWENVPGALSSTHGEDFGCLLRSMDELGYGLAWRVLDAQFFGVAQRRRRLFLVGNFGEGGAQRACEVLFESEGLRRDTPSSREKRQALARGAGNGAEGAGCLNGWDVQSRRVFDAAGIAPTLSSGTAEGANIQPCVMDVAPTIMAQRGRGAQPPNVLSYGFKYHAGASSGTTGFGEECAPTQIAGKPPAVVTNYGEDVAGTLTARGDSSAGPSQGQNVVVMTDTQPNSLVSDEVCGTLTHRMHKDPPLAAVDVMASYAMRMRGGKAGGGKEPLVQEGVSGTLATRNDQTVFVGVAANQRGECRLQGGDGAVAGAIPCTQSGKQFNGVTDGYVVRLLTPVECERLQGFPDGWTQVPYRGKPAGECPDGPRYKALGNSMAVPVMEWIGKRILAVETLYGAGLWSNPGDVVLSPFGGIGSEGYQAIKMGREYVGIELKPSYFREACRNLAAAERERAQDTLF